MERELSKCTSVHCTGRATKWEKYFCSPWNHKHSSSSILLQKIFHPNVVVCGAGRDSKNGNCPTIIRCLSSLSMSRSGGYCIETRSKAKTKFTSVVPSYNRRSSECRRTVVQLYNSSKTQNAHNLGHRHATDLYFTFLEMGEKVFIVKFLWHRRDLNPWPTLVMQLLQIWELDAKSSRLHFEEELVLFAAQKRVGGLGLWVSAPPKRHIQSFPFPAHMRAEVMFT